MYSYNYIVLKWEEDSKNVNNAKNRCIFIKRNAVLVILFNHFQANLERRIIIKRLLMMF